jgi:hypothetical protein
MIADVASDSMVPAEIIGLIDKDREMEADRFELITDGPLNLAIPYCPHCDSGDVQRYGTTTAGSVRYRCKSCKHTFTPNAAKRGRPMIGDRPLTPTEKMQRQRAKKKPAG